MVQLPATAAIEYVAACCRTRTRTRTRTKTGTKRKIGTITKIVRGAYARSPKVQCVYAPSRLSVPSIVAWRTNKQTNKTTKNTQTRPPNSAGSRPPLPKFSGYVEVDAHYIFHQSTIWARPLCTELGPKKPLQNADFAMKQTNICRLSGDIKTKKDKLGPVAPRGSAGSWPPLPKFSGYVEVAAHYIFHPSTISVRPLFTKLGPKNPHFAIKANEYMSP